MPIKVYVQLAREKIVDVEYNMAELADLAQNKEIHLVSIQMKNQWRGMVWMTDQTPIVKLPQAYEYAHYYQILQCNILQCFHL